MKATDGRDFASCKILSVDYELPTNAAYAGVPCYPRAVLRMGVYDVAANGMLAGRVFLMQYLPGHGAPEFLVPRRLMEKTLRHDWQVKIN
jgi:hypothetical protein